MVHKINRLLAIVGIIILLTGCNVGIGPAKEELQTNTETPQEDVQLSEEQLSKNKLDIAMQQPLTLHPLYNMDKSVQQNLYLLFDTLVNIEEDGNITPNIATSWTYNPQDFTLTLNLRSDISWHDGEKLTADDVIFSIQTIQTANESPYKQSTRNIGNVQKINEYSVKIYYRQPFSGVMQTLYFPIIPEHVYNKPVEEALALKPIGSGPYRYAEQISNKEIIFTANPTYFLGEPQIKTIEVMIAPDEESMLYAFEQSLIDVIYTDVMDWGKYAKDKSAKIHEMHTQYYEFMGVNFDYAIFQEEWLREALIYSLDRENLLDIYYLGHGVVTDTPISPHSYLYYDQLGVKEYNKEKAKLILAQEEYTLDENNKMFTKNGQPLQFSLMVNQENTQRMRIAEGMKQMYAQVGIDVIIEAVDRETYLNRLYNKEFEAFLGGWKLSYIPDLTFAFHSAQVNGGDNFVSYEDAKMDELLQAAFVSTPDQIEEAYKNLQEYIAEQNPYISLYFRNAALITKKHITGTIDPDPLNIYANVEEWKID